MKLEDDREGLRLELRHPDRYRCANCKSPFRGTVIDGLWCSKECVIVPAVSDNPNDWPRQHYSPPIDGRPKKAKRSFASPEDARRTIGLWRKTWTGAKFQDKQIYCCTYCFQWHIGGPSKSKG